MKKLKVNHSAHWEAMWAGPKQIAKDLGFKLEGPDSEFGYLCLLAIPEFFRPPDFPEEIKLKALALLARRPDGHKVIWAVRQAIEKRKANAICDIIPRAGLFRVAAGKVAIS